MTKAQLRFAARHDWFIDGDAESVTVLEVWSDKDGGGSCRKVFTDFDDLYAWAGY